MPQKHALTAPKLEQLLASTAEVRINKWAIFRSLRNIKTCRLTTLYATKELATERARDLAAASFADNSKEFTYFVVKVEHEVGITQGVMFDRGV